MKHVLILSAVHCQPEVIKHTLGTWLDTYDGSYKATVCLSVQTDYPHFSKRLNEITSMPNVEIIRVKPLDFEGAAIRPSRFHARCLRHLVQHCEDWSFTHIAILDHDLEFKTDFVKWAINQDKDWVLSLFRDRKEPLFLEGRNWMAKPSIWHMVISRRLFARIVGNPKVLLPDVLSGNRVYDTASKLYEVATAAWNMNISTYPESEIVGMVEHLWMLSFTYGRDCGGEEYRTKLRELKNRHAARFPNGIDHLLSRLTAAPSV